MTHGPMRLEDSEWRDLLTASLRASFPNDTSWEVARYFCDTSLADVSLISIWISCSTGGLRKESNTLERGPEREARRKLSSTCHARLWEGVGWRKIGSEPQGRAGAAGKGLRTRTNSCRSLRPFDLRIILVAAAAVRAPMSSETT